MSKETPWYQQEELVPLTSPLRLGIKVPPGKKKSVIQKLRRWWRSGLNGPRKSRVKLVTFLDGGVRCTSKERYLDFLRRINGIEA